MNLTSKKNRIYDNTEDGWVWVANTKGKRLTQVNSLYIGKLKELASGDKKWKYLAGQLSHLE